VAVFVVLVVLLAVAFVQDALQSKIANTITVPGMFVGLVLSVTSDREGWLSGLLDSSAGLLVGFIVMLLLYAMGAVGAGDVKLFGAIGAIAGLQFVLYGIMNAVLCAGIVGLAILLWKREIRQRMRTVGAALLGVWIWRDIRPVQALKQADPLRFPFMYAVLPAMGLTWWTLGY
jgi:prepilin peptidase CpaA